MCSEPSGRFGRMENGEESMSLFLIFWNKNVCVCVCVIVGNVITLSKVPDINYKSCEIYDTE